MATTGRDICTDALLEINAVAAGETPSADDMAIVLGKLVRLIDAWNAQRQAVYAQVFTNYTLTANLSPHTIGPTGTFVVTQRPVTIDGASIRLTTQSPVVNVPLTPRDAEWWKAQTVQALTSSLPTDLYYNPTWPNGSLYLWPVPSYAWGLQLETRVLLSQLGLDDTFSLPPGYQDAVTLTLAEACCATFEKPMPETLPALAAKARAIVFSNNSTPVRLQTQDAGMPRGNTVRSDYNWLTGNLTGR